MEKHRRKSGSHASGADNRHLVVHAAGRPFIHNLFWRSRPRSQRLDFLRPEFCPRSESHQCAAIVDCAAEGAVRPRVSKSQAQAGCAERPGAHPASDCKLPEGFVLRWCNGPVGERTPRKYQQKRRVELYAEAQKTNRCRYRLVRFRGLPSGPSVLLGPFCSALGALRNQRYRCARIGSAHSKKAGSRLCRSGYLSRDRAQKARPGRRILRTQCHLEPGT